MAQSTFDQPTFNLWEEAWITVERLDGEGETLNIPQTLTEAHRIRALYDPSPLVTVAIHRLLLAILQAVTHPQSIADLRRVWRAGQFSAEQLNAFAQQYAHRFDLFSPDAPFLQSADLPLQPAKKGKGKPVSYLMPEEPSGTGVTHYTHAYDREQRLCSRCAAKGLLMIPAFASSGGAGNKPSINGVPPIYVIPGGKTLFQKLAASLTTGAYQPPTFEDEPVSYDVPWWEHAPIVTKKGIVKRVGYLQSLTFPARRIRLHPIPGGQIPCTRCGETTPWHAATMVYEMGESRPKDAAWWRDPFAAYRKPKKEKDAPIPIRPVEGRAMWREFAGFVLPVQKDEKGLQSFRPAILDQLECLSDVLPYGDDPIPLQLVGLRTDMKMKIFEWQESGFTVPPRLLSDVDRARFIEDGLEFARQCDVIIKGTFKQYFGGSGKSNRLKSVTNQMSRQYWQRLGVDFRHYLPQYAVADNGQIVFENWLKQVVRQANAVFREAAESLSDDGLTLRKRVEAVNHCGAKLNVSRKKYLPQEETA